MVSFQCDGCQDVVKKPKLDQHYSRGCHASFTCIDCSKTFPSPPAWKSHTSCISESQKYEKSLYQPKASGGGREYNKQYKQSASAGKYYGHRTSLARPPLGRQRFQPTGANGTPLGTPTRMSPVTKTADESDNATSHTPAAKKELTDGKEQASHKKWKPDGDAPPTVEASPSKAASEPVREKKEKKEKKKERKEKKGDNKEGTAKDTTASAKLDVPLPASLSTVDSSVKKRKDSKKEKRDKNTAARKEMGDTANGHDATVVVDRDAIMSDTTPQTKEKKKKKKGKEEGQSLDDVADGDVSMLDAVTQLEENKSKEKRKRDVETGEEKDAKKSKKKKIKTSS